MSESLGQLLQDLQNGKYKKVIIMTGAGISTEAGIPDFRSPKTGLYSNLQKFNLPYPEAVFDIEYLRERPEAFFLLAGEMYPSQFKPTKFHEFIKWVSDLGCLKRVYTQNIDTLERAAGVPDELLVEAHGSFANNHCIECGLEANKEWVEDTILNSKRVPHCEKCGGIVKPDIVFFGESLPDRFHELIETDFEDVDLAIVAGSSLEVSPFNQLPKMVKKNVPRYLFNLTKVGDLGRRKRDVLILGDIKQNNVTFDKYIHNIERDTNKGSKESKSSEVSEASSKDSKDSSKSSEISKVSSKGSEVSKLSESTSESSNESTDESTNSTDNTDAPHIVDRHDGKITSLLRRLRLI